MSQPYGHLTIRVRYAWDSGGVAGLSDPGGSIPRMPAQNITRGTYRVLDFTVLGPDGTTPDTTTVAAFGSAVPTNFAIDPHATDLRKCYVSCLASGAPGAANNVSITARGHTATQLMQSVEPPDLSNVVLGAFGPELPLPHP